MTGELRDFKEELRRELVAAAYREQASRRSGAFGVRPGWRLSPVAGLAAAGLLVVAVLGVGALRSAPVAADVFAITAIDERVELAVVDIVVDPETVTRQVEAELGLETELVAVPVPPVLVGQIMATANKTGDATAEIRRGPDGTIEAILLPAGYDGTLYIEYGRRAAPGEGYRFLATDPACAELWGLHPSEASPTLNRMAGTLQYETIDIDIDSTMGVASEDLDPTYQLVDLVFLDEDTLLVTYAADPSDQPRDENCKADS